MIDVTTLNTIPTRVLRVMVTDARAHVFHLPVRATWLLDHYASKGMTPTHARVLEHWSKALETSPDVWIDMLDWVLRERDDAESRPQPELVWTGPELDTPLARDTAVVARHMFAHAQNHVLIATYIIYQGKDLFEPLTKQMALRPELDVTLILHINPDVGLHATRERFVRYQWPDPKRLPRVFYYPETLDTSRDYRFSMHAKCIVVDHEQALVTSANFTEAAHERNIEVGVLMSDPGLASSLTSQFETLIQRRVLLPLDLDC